MPGDSNHKAEFKWHIETLLNGEALFPLSPLQLLALKKSNPTLLSYYNHELEQLNPATFVFLNNEKKAALQKRLQHTLSVLTIQQSIDQMEHRAYQQNGINIASQIELCQKYQRRLNALQAPPNAALASALPEVNAAASPVPYLGFSLARWLADQVGIVSGSNTTTIRNWLNAINERRLYWVWGGDFFRMTLEQIQNDFYNNEQAQQIIARPKDGLGYLSWVLYYTRLGLNLFLFLKHVIPGSWMSEEEKKIPLGARINGQWQQRKFALLNDIAWGTVNLACFFWLVGSTSLTYAANALILGLVFVDALLAAWRLTEEKNKFQDEQAVLDEKIFFFENEIQQLESNLQGIKDRLLRDRRNATVEETRRLQAILNQLNHAKRSKAELEQLKEHAKTTWNYKKLGLWNDLAYSSLLMAGWSVMGGIYFPVAETAIQSMGYAGGIFCFALTLLYQAVSIYIEVSKVKNQIKENNKQIAELQKQFDAIDDHYELRVKQPGQSIEKNKVYLEFQANLIMCTLIHPVTGTAVTGKINIKDIDPSITPWLTLEKLRPHTAKILSKIPPVNDDMNEKRRLFLEIKKLEADNEYQHKMVNFQKWKLVRATIFDALIPAILFATLVFLPTGAGIGIFVACAVLMLVTKLVMNLFEPKPKPAPEFNDDEFEKFKGSRPEKPQTALDRNSLFHERHHAESAATTATNEDLATNEDNAATRDNFLDINGLFTV